MQPSWNSIDTAPKHQYLITAVWIEEFDISSPTECRIARWSSGTWEDVQGRKVNPTHWLMECPWLDTEPHPLRFHAN